VSPFNLNGASFGGLYLPNTPLNPIWTKKPQEEEEEEEKKIILSIFLLSPPFLYPILKCITTLSNGYLGSPNDEERSEMRYVMRIAELSESSNL